ncbi:MSHA biogenesis protein MshL [Candidatus Magnetomoraceae bacterium gMMP-13]
MPLKEPEPPKIQKDFIPPQDLMRKFIKKTPPSALPPLAALKPMIAAEEKMPYESRLFSLSTRSAPLQDILLGLAKEADLNLVIEKAVNLMEPVSLEIKDLSLKLALDTILSAYEYFYEINGNILRVKALETRFFQFDYPLLYNVAESEVGGDVLGEGGGGSDLSGEFTIETEVSGSEHLNIWEQIEKALTPAGTGQNGLLSNQGRALVNRMSGTIVLTDRRENILLAEKFLNKLEISLRRQVVIEAKIIEVTLNHDHQYGIDWNYLQNQIGGSGALTFSSELSTGGAAVSVGFLDSFSRGTFELFLDALSVQGNLNVLSSPRLNVLNNQSALISVGQTIPYLDFETNVTTDPNDSTRTITTLEPTINKAQAGITLGITPQISEDSVTTLHIVPIITDLAAEKSFSYNGTDWTVPVIQVRETDTIVRAPDGVTVVIGGLIQDRTDDLVTKIPLLGDIPFLGRLFSNQKRSNSKSEMVILLTPTVVEK